jgi:hypothetical protein
MKNKTPLSKKEANLLFDKKLRAELEFLISAGVLEKKKINGQFGYIDTPYCKKIDKMNPREAFLEGIKKGMSLICDKNIPCEQKKK